MERDTQWRRNKVRVRQPEPKSTPWADVKPGQWFYTSPDGGMFPCMKADDGGIISPANGHHSTTEQNPYREVYLVPDGTEVVILVGMRERHDGND